jgi:hypothetical protein
LWTVVICCSVNTGGGDDEGILDEVTDAAMMDDKLPEKRQKTQSKRSKAMPGN